MSTELKHPQWVKCSERMPIKEGFYWVLNHQSLVCKQREAYFRGGPFFLRRDTATESWTFEMRGVTHWLDAPNPEPDDGFPSWWKSLESVKGTCGTYHWLKGFVIHEDSARECYQAGRRSVQTP